MQEKNDDLYKKLRPYHEMDLNPSGDLSIPNPFEMLFKQINTLRREQSRTFTEVESLTDKVKKRLSIDEVIIEKIRDKTSLLEKQKEMLLSGLIDLIDLLYNFYPFTQQFQDEQAKNSINKFYENISRHILPKMGFHVEQPKKGDHFDPLHHSSKSVKWTDDLPEGAILEVLSIGYAFGGEVLRKAVVTVNSKGGM